MGAMAASSSIYITTNTHGFDWMRREGGRKGEREGGREGERERERPGFGFFSLAVRSYLQHFQRTKRTRLSWARKVSTTSHHMVNTVREREGGGREREIENNKRLPNSYFIHIFPRLAVDLKAFDISSYNANL